MWVLQSNFFLRRSFIIKAQKPELQQPRLLLIYDFQKKKVQSVYCNKMSLNLGTVLFSSGCSISKSVFFFLRLCCFYSTNHCVFSGSLSGYTSMQVLLVCVILVAGKRSVRETKSIQILERIVILFELWRPNV